MCRKGISYDDAIKRTGLTRRQLEYKTQTTPPQIRFKKIGKYVYFHPDDIAALEKIENDGWEGTPINGSE